MVYVVGKYLRADAQSPLIVRELRVVANNTHARIAGAVNGSVACTSQLCHCTGGSFHHR